MRRRDSEKIVTLLFNYLWNLILHFRPSRARRNILFKLKFQARALHSLEFSPFAPRQRSQKEIPVLQPRAIHTLFLLSTNTMLLHLLRKQFYWARAGRAKKQVRKERRKLFKWHVRVVRSLMTLCFSLWTTWFEKELNPFGSRRLLATLFATPMCMHSIDPLWSGNIANNEQRKSICCHRCWSRRVDEMRIFQPLIGSFQL